MLVLEVPFSKWAHLAYRPLALYFAELRREAIGQVEAPPLPAGARPVKAA
jgi:heterodisulfide reductase subunit C/quinone-modifying oxidoreductase subunit QmoC